MNQKKLRKLSNGYLLIKVDKPPEQDDKGVYIAEEWKTLPPTGTVQAMAQDVTVCKIGEKVFFLRYTAIETPFGDDMRLCREDAILAVIYD